MTQRLRWNGSMAARREYEEALRKLPPKPVPLSRKPSKRKNKTKAEKRAERLRKQKDNEQNKQGKPSVPAKKEWIDYKQYLTGSWWKSRRKKKLKSVGYKCEKCGKSIKSQVHHLHYRSLNQEKDEDLQAVCRECHELQHEATVGADNHLKSINGQLR